MTSFEDHAIGGRDRAGEQLDRSVRLEVDPTTRGSGPVPTETRLEILRQVAAGRRGVDVAREYGVHPTTISGWKREERESAEETRVPAASATQGAVAMTPARETGRYSKAFKEEVLGQVESGRKVIDVARQYGIPDGTIQRWRRAAREAGGELRDPKSTRPESAGPSPIDEEHRRLVLSLKEKHPKMGPAQIQNQLKRFYAVKLSRHMIGRIFAEAGIPLQKRSGDTDSDPAKNRFEMSRPNELWAVDFKELWIHSQKAQALFLLDDFSRFCLGFALTQKPTAELAISTTEAAIQRYGRPERVLSDRGPQFHAWNGVSQFDEFLADFLTDHTVTKANHCFTNGKIEAFNRSIEEELFDVEEFASLREAEEAIRRHIHRYNFFRTHMGIGGLVPADRYFGMVEEAQRALEEGLKRSGPGLRWLRGLVSEDGAARRQPSVLQLVVRDGKLELVVLGRRFQLG
jgi:transposase InsO family protein/transposase-like protein